MVKVYTDGIFDLFHYGHSQYFRNIKELYKSDTNFQLIVGISSDIDTHQFKGIYPIMTEMERAQVVRDCKYVDVVIENAPWEITDSFISQNQIDWVVHEDKPYILGASDGHDVYARVKELGKFQHMDRTQGISTSDIKRRILNQSKAISDNLQKRMVLENSKEVH